MKLDRSMCMLAVAASLAVSAPMAHAVRCGAIVVDHGSATARSSAPCDRDEDGRGAGPAMPSARLPESRLPDERLPDQRLPDTRLPDSSGPGPDDRATERDARPVMLQEIPMANPRFGALPSSRRYVDPNREERQLRERMYRDVRKVERGTPAGSPECDAILRQVGEQRPSLHSLRAEVRNQARSKVERLTSEFRERGC